jgi:hypothetical protein
MGSSDMDDWLGRARISLRTLRNLEGATKKNRRIAKSRANHFEIARCYAIPLSASDQRLELTATQLLKRWGLEVCYVELGAFAGDRAALQDKEDAFCDVRGVIANALNVLCTKEKMHS